MVTIAVQLFYSCTVEPATTIMVGNSQSDYTYSLVPKLVPKEEGEAKAELGRSVCFVGGFCAVLAKSWQSRGEVAELNQALQS